MCETTLTLAGSSGWPGSSSLGRQAWCCGHRTGAPAPRPGHRVVLPFWHGGLQRWWESVLYSFGFFFSFQKHTRQTVSIFYAKCAIILYPRGHQPPRGVLLHRCRGTLDQRHASNGYSQKTSAWGNKSKDFFSSFHTHLFIHETSACCASVGIPTWRNVLLSSRLKWSSCCAMKSSVTCKRCPPLETLARSSCSALCSCSLRTRSFISRKIRPKFESNEK